MLLSDKSLPARENKRTLAIHHIDINGIDATATHRDGINPSLSSTARIAWNFLSGDQKSHPRASVPSKASYVVQTMSRTTAWLLLWASTFMAQTAAAQTETDAGKEQVVKVEDWSVSLPPGWSRFPLPLPKTLLTVVAPAAAGETFRDNIGFKKYPLQQTSDLDKILNAQKNGVERQFKLIGSGKLEGGQSRIVWMAIKDKKPDDGEELAKIDYLMIHGDHLYALHAMCPTKKLAGSRQAFDAIARSVKFPPGAAMPPPAEQKSNDSRRSQDYENGRKVGQYTVWAMVAGVVIWGVKSVVRRGKG